MAVVTVTRQFGAGGSRVAELVASSLGWALVDNEFVDAVAARSGLPPADVAVREERAPSLLERLVRALATASPEVFVPGAAPEREEEAEALVTTTEQVIADAAAADDVVMVGRGAQAFFARARRDGALHAWIVAPRRTRIETIMARAGLAQPDAERLLDTTDADRDRYVARYYDRQRQDPANYHLVLNTGLLGYDDAAGLIVAAVRRKGWA